MIIGEHSSTSTVMRALAAWEFPNEPLLANADSQFLLGSTPVVAPDLAQSANITDGVFPGFGHGEVWYDRYTQFPVAASPGQNITIDAPLGHIPVYIRGGSVLPT
jgi:alpha-glucosidase